MPIPVLLGLLPVVLPLSASDAASPPPAAAFVGPARPASSSDDDAPHAASYASVGQAYGSFLGGAFLDLASAVRVRADGKLVFVGQTASRSFPATPGAAQEDLLGLTDAFVACVDPADGSLEWATFLGGSDASLFFPEAARALAFDAAGRVVVVGQANSPDFPTTPGAYAPTQPGPLTVDAFVAKLDVDGTLLWSTYLGGTDDDYATSVALDSAGRVVVGGYTFSSDFPVSVGAYDTSFSSIFFTDDAFVARLASDGSALDWASFLGGSLRDEITALALDPANGDVLLAGLTGSPDFPATPGAFDTSFNGTSGQKVDAFAARLAASGDALQWATFVGGAEVVEARALDLASDGDVVLAGTTESADLPTTPGALQPMFGGGTSDGFVARVESDGSALAWCSYFGASGDDAISALALTASDQPTLAGMTTSRGFVTTSDAPDKTLGGPQDAFLVRLDVDATKRTHATFLGGAAASDEALGLALDGFGAAWSVGRTDASDFPVSPDALDATFGGTGDVFVASHDLGPWIDLGHALAGFGGAAPRLVGGGTLEGGAPYSLVLDRARPNALCILFLGFSIGSVNFKCGTLVPFPFAASFTLTTFPDGTVPLFVPAWPLGIPPMTTVVFQYFIADPAAICGAAGSNALQAYTP